MTKTVFTKRALILSLLSMLLCVSMLIGSTYAWFTDTAMTAVNKIQAGTLDVALEMKDNNGNWVTAEGKTLQFLVDGQIPAEGTQILWEPGCTYSLPELRVVNKGNLALKYKVVITGINGSAKLNDVIDWTVMLDGEAFTIGTEHHLAAKVGETVDADILTVKGHMREDVGNDYQNETIDGIGITVYATQDAVESDSNGNQYDKDADGTPAFDTWFDTVAVTETVATDADTVIKDKDANPNIQITVPANSTNAASLTLHKDKSGTPANITVETGTNAVTAEVKLTDANGNAVTASAGKYFTLTMLAGKKLNVIGFYHNGTALTPAESEALTANDQYYYNAETGYVTFTTDDFSPFTVVVSESAFNGGDGTAAHPYLIANGEQALKMEDYKGNFKFVADVVVSDEIYLSRKTVVVDLNGHSVKLEYGAGVKPNNGSVFYIGGKKGNLTINDSSEAQTGAVIGSDKSYSNKVTSAVRAGNYGKLTINGGHFYGTSEGTSCIFVYTSMSSGSKATVVINGGKFETATPSNGTYFVLNHQDGASAGCTITVNGGSFKNYNPGVTFVDPDNAKTGKIVLGDGCTTTQDGEWYVVSK